MLFQAIENHTTEHSLSNETWIFIGSRDGDLRLKRKQKHKSNEEFQFPYLYLYLETKEKHMPSLKDTNPLM